MAAMRRALFLALLVVLATDFTTPDVPVAVAGARVIEWDDEEESVPSRRPRAGAEQRPVRVLPPGQRSLEPDQPRGCPVAMAAAVGPERAMVWLGPIRTGSPFAATCRSFSTHEGAMR
jgi:hypothetical protein